MSTLKAFIIGALILSVSRVSANTDKPAFRVIAFFTAKEDPAHISFVHEAERWFPEMAAKYHFSFDTTSNWHDLNADFLAAYQVVVFLDTRPEDPAQRAAFQSFMEHGGGWMGFHFAGFALTLRILRQQHLETDVGHSPCRRPQPSGDLPSAGDVQVLAQ